VEEEDDDHPKMTAQFDRRAMFHEFYGAEPSTALDSSQPEAANRSKPAKPEVVPITDDAGSDSDSLEEADLEAKIAHMGHHTMAKPPTKEEEKKHKSFLAKFSVKNLIHKKNDESRRSSYPKRLKSLGRSLASESISKSTSMPAKALAPLVAHDDFEEEQSKQTQERTHTTTFSFRGLKAPPKNSFRNSFSMLTHKKLISPPDDRNVLLSLHIPHSNLTTIPLCTLYDSHHHRLHYSGFEAIHDTIGELIRGCIEIPENLQQTLLDYHANSFYTVTFTVHEKTIRYSEKNAVFYFIHCIHGEKTPHLVVYFPFHIREVKTK